MKNVLTTMALVMCAAYLVAQNPIDVTEMTVKVSGSSTEKLHYAFEKGDQIVFSFSETNKKPVKIVEIKRYPNDTKFQDYESREVKSKTISVPERGIYEFRFKNNKPLKGRVCKVKIQRIPASPETASFNTGVRYETRYDTTQYSVQNRVMVRSDTSVVQLRKETARVSTLSPTNIDIRLPESKFYPSSNSPMRAKYVASWGYTLASGDTGMTWYKDANKRAKTREMVNLATNAGLISTGYGAMGVLLVEGVSLFSNPPEGDNVKYSIRAYYNDGTNIKLAGGNSIAVCEKITELRKGGCTLKLVNDNWVNGINVYVEIGVLMVDQEWQMQTEWKDEITSGEIPVMIEKSDNLPVIREQSQQDNGLKSRQMILPASNGDQN